MSAPSNHPDLPSDPLLTPVQFIRNVGPARAALLERLSLRTVADLLFCMPRDALDLSNVRQPEELEAGVLQSVRGTIVDRDSRTTSTGKVMVAALLRCGRDFVRGVWFNQPWMFRKLQMEQVVVFSGKPKRASGRWEFSTPIVQWLDVDDDDSGQVAVLPRYNLTEGLRMDEMRKITRAAVEDFVHLLPDRIPADLLTRWNLLPLRQAVIALHMPASMAEFNAGIRRLLFEDLLEFQLAVALRRRSWRRGETAPVLKSSQKIDSRIRRLFPFQFTQGQNQAVQDIAHDLASGQTMHRLLQADVGAGKTAIAVYAMLVTIAGDHQAALMAPTELLASQHWQTIDRLLSESRVRRALLTGTLTAAERRRTLEQISSGELQLVVGTQALIQKDVRFHKLGLAVIDEQHRFGVSQRATFSMGEQSPHVLVMTATPIPRSLCLTQFGDLDMTLINELPPGRLPVRTYRVPTEDLRRRAWNFIRERIAEGRQVYVVCPRVGDEDDEPPPERTPSLFDRGQPVNEAGPEVPGFDLSPADTGTVEELFRQLCDGELKGLRVGRVHGRMDSRQKSETMDLFREGELDALISTTVIEVGVDVPNATVMVIQEAERFGLSQLHQLRGRVGRGRHQGYCLLFSDATAPDAVKRLAALEQHADGFQIAEVDFDLRGPGDILGTKQHGALPLKFADLRRDKQLLEEARKVAFDLVERGEFDTPACVPLKVSVLDRFGELLNLPRSG